MRIEIMYFVGWITVPMVAYTSAQWAIRHSNQRSALRTRTDAAGVWTRCGPSASRPVPPSAVA